MELTLLNETISKIVYFCAIITIECAIITIE